MWIREKLGVDIWMIIDFVSIFEMAWMRNSCKMIKMARLKSNWKVSGTIRKQQGNLWRKAIKHHQKPDHVSNR